MAAAAIAVVFLGGCTDDEPTAASFCDELGQAPSLAAVLTGFADQDPTQLQRQLDDAEAQYDDLRDTAPDVIAPDVDRTVELVDAVIAAVRADRDDPAAAAAAIRDVVDDHPDATTSGLAVADYAREQCEVELNPDLGAAEDPGSGDGTPPDPVEGEDGSVTGGM